MGNCEAWHEAAAKAHKRFIKNCRTFVKSKRFELPDGEWVEVRG